MSEHTEQEDLEILAKSDLLVPDSLTMRELADHFMELWGEHLADTQASLTTRSPPRPGRWAAWWIAL